MKFKSLISLVICSILFFVSCGGGNTEGGTATSETSCANNGAFNCKDRFEGATLSDRIRKYVLWLGFTESDMQTIRDIMFEGPSQEPGTRGIH